MRLRRKSGGLNRSKRFRFHNCVCCSDLFYFSLFSNCASSVRKLHICLSQADGPLVAAESALAVGSSATVVME